MIVALMAPELQRVACFLTGVLEQMRVQLGLQKLVTQVCDGNTASRRALERVGYRTVGIYRRHEFRRGQWWDVWIGELLRDEWLVRQPAG